MWSEGWGGLALFQRTPLGAARWWLEAGGDPGPSCQVAPRAQSGAGIPRDFWEAHFPPAQWPVAQDCGVWGQLGED